MLTKTGISLLNRRAFLQRTALAGLATAAGTQLNRAAADAAKWRWKFCAFEKPVLFLNYEDTADFFAELGFDGVEAAVRPGGHVLPERVEEDLPKFVAALRRRGLELTILTSGISRVDQPHAEKTLRTAAQLGIRRYRLDWWRYDLQRPVAAQLEDLRPRLKALAALNRSLGLTGLYQNHAGANLVGAPLWDIYSLIREQDPRDLALAFDIRHATVEGGLCWPVQFNLVRSHVGAVYFKDFVWQERQVVNVPLGRGLVDRKFATLLRESEFAGPISLHVEYGSGREVASFRAAFRQDFAALRDWLRA